MKAIVMASAIAAMSGAALGQGMIINEILGSTSGSDWEFIEILNNGTAPVDITGWGVALYDSDIAAPGGLDGGSPHFVVGNVILNPGETYTWMGSLADPGYAGGSYNGTPFSWDVLLGTNIVENSSYTAILEDGSGNAIFSAFVTDGGAGDFANQAGAAITPDITVGPDGTFTPAGFAVLDKNLNTTWLNFDTALLNDGTIAGGTPGVNQKIPTPGALALLGVSGLAATRRRR
ncbi:MAG: lamin tail domain-containing protein [Phycisphaerales bacterium]|nr:lamin tail domain-containing protein [Phycisphaerales bacterium]